MAEMFLTASYTHDFYKRCTEYIKEYEAVFENARKFLAGFGVKPDDVAVGVSCIAVTDTPEYRKIFAGKYKVEDGFLTLKKNCKPGKDWKEKLPWKPSICFELGAADCHRWREVKFIYDNTLYARIGGKNLKVPDGFNKIEGSEFYKVVEKINKGKLDYIEM